MNHPYSGLGYGFAHELQHLASYRAIYGSYLHIAKVVLISVLSGLVGLVAIQVVYPSSRTTPLLQLQGIRVGNVAEATLQERLSTLDQRTVTIKAYNQTYNPTYQDSGIEVNTETTASRLLSYDLADRLKPFSIFRRDSNQTVALRHNDQKVAALAAKIASENVQTAKNATLAKTGVTYAVATPSVDGVQYDPSEVTDQLKNIAIAEDVTVVVPGEVQRPAVHTTDLTQAIATAEQQTASSLELVVEETKLQITEQELKSFVEISVDEASGKITVGYNRAAIKAHVMKLADQVYKPGSASVITLRDGVEVNRVTGRLAKAVSVDEGINAVIDSLGKNQNQVHLSLKPVTIAAKFVRTYSPTSTGLQTLVNDWQKDTGLNASVVVKELGSPYRSASLSSTKTYVAASLYKLYVANYLYNGIQSGTIDPNSHIGIAKSVSGCLDAMIVVSDNACPVAIGGSLGWNGMTALAHANGFSGTSLQGGNMRTNAADTALFLEKLHNGSLMGALGTSSLLSSMKRQIYRNAIPKGSSGTVANKVGFVDGYWHDAAIVYHPKGTYILVVMTYGGGPSQIADLAARINSFMSQ